MNKLVQNGKKSENRNRLKDERRNRIKGLGEVRILTPRGGVGWLVGGLIRKY